MDNALVSLRPATEDDFGALVAIEKKIQTTPWTAEHFQAELAKPYSRVLLLTDDETDSVLVGYVVFWVMGEDCHILNLGVDPGFRGLGHGKRIVRQALQQGVRGGATRAVLEVRKSNTAALNLYQALHFRIDQIRKAFYSNGEDAYQMTLNLTGEGVTVI